MIFFMPLPLMLTPLPMIQPYINLHPSSGSLPPNARSQSRLATSSTINSDLQRISVWETRNSVKFNTSKTQLLTISLSNPPSNYPIIFDDSQIPPFNSINILGIQISSSLSWRDHIIQIAKSASKKLGVLFRCKQYFNSAHLFKLYIGFIYPCLEYCSYIWGSSPYTSLLDRVESKAIRLIGDPSLTSILDPLSLRCRVASLSLFYRYYFGHCSEELAACIPPPMAQPCSTRQASFAHSCCVELSNARINWFNDDFFHSASCLWNSLPSSVLPASFNLSSKGMSITTLGTRWHDFITLFRYFIFLFYSFHYLFLFLSDADSRKGTLCPFCVPIHVVKTAFTLWANHVLKRCSAVMAKVKDSICFESFMDLRNTRLFNSTELFPLRHLGEDGGRVF